MSNEWVIGRLPDTKNLGEKGVSLKMQELNMVDEPSMEEIAQKGIHSKSDKIKIKMEMEMKMEMETKRDPIKEVKQEEMDSTMQVQVEVGSSVMYSTMVGEPSM